MPRGLQLGALRLARVAGLAAERRRVAPAGRTTTSPWLIAFQVRGQSSWRQGEWRTRLRAGDFMICPTDRPYSLRFAGEYEMPVLWLDAPAMERVTAEPSRFALAALRREDADVGLVTSFVGTLVGAADRLSAAMTLRAESQVLGLLAGALAGRDAGVRATPAQRRATVKAYVHEHVHDAHLSVAAIAARFGCTTRHLHALFAREPLTLGRYIRRTRVQECLRAIERGAEAGSTLSAIAARWGFYDASHLRRCFRSELGLSTAALRGRLARAALH